MSLERAERWVRWAGAWAGLATLTIAVWGFWRAQSRPAGRETGAARLLLRRPVLLAATALFIGAGARLWRPLPMQPAAGPRHVMLALGGALYFSGLVLYLWGRRALGEMFDAASGFGVRLQAGHRLITTGPYSYIRHPMYLAVIVTGMGGALVYRTWAAALFAINMLGLVYRAVREEQALAQEFGEQWAAYARQVPAWIPRFQTVRSKTLGVWENPKGFLLGNYI